MVSWRAVDDLRSSTARPPRTAGDHAMTDQRLILIVDDDYDFLEINRHILEKAGFRVVTASSPSQAMDRIDAETPRPGHHRPHDERGRLRASRSRAGCATTRAPPTCPIIMSTSVTTALGLDFKPRSADDLANMRVDAYFDKPLEAAALVAKVRELLRETADADRRTTASSPPSRNAAGAATPACANARPRPSASSTARRASSPRAASAAPTASGSAPRTPSRPTATSSAPSTCSPRATRWSAIVAPSFPAEFTDIDEGVARRHDAQARLRRRPRGRLRRRPGGPRVRQAARRQTTTALHRHALPGGRVVRAQVPPRPRAVAGADRLADDRHLARPARRRHARRPTSRSCSSAPASPRRARRPAPSSQDEIDAVLTFTELRQMFD